MLRRGDHLLKEVHVTYGVCTDSHPDRLITQLFEFGRVFDTGGIAQCGIEPCTVSAELLVHVNCLLRIGAPTGVAAE